MAAKKQDDEVLKQFVTEVVRASPEYMRKEGVRQAIQGVITSLVASGEIRNDSDLESFFGSADMSLKALKMVPYTVFSKLAGHK